MNAIISDIALDLGPFALDLEFEDENSHDCGVPTGGRDCTKMCIPAKTGNIEAEQSLGPLHAAA
jgi:hypothetical protein